MPTISTLLILAILGLGFGWLLGGNLFRHRGRGATRADSPRPPSAAHAATSAANPKAKPAPADPVPVEVAWYTPESEPTVQFNDRDLAAIIAERDHARDSLRRVDRAWEAERTRMREERDQALAGREAALRALTEARSGGPRDAHLDAERDAHGAELRQLETERDQAQMQAAALQAALDEALIAARDAQDEALIAAQAANRQLRDENRLLIAQLDAVPTAVDAADSDEGDWSDRLEAQAQAVELLQAQSDGLRAQLEQAQAAQQRLHEQVASLRARDSAREQRLAQVMKELAQLEGSGAPEAGLLRLHLHQRLAHSPRPSDPLGLEDGATDDPAALADLAQALANGRARNRGAEAAAVALRKQLAEVEGWAQVEAARSEELRARLVALEAEQAEVRAAQEGDRDALATAQAERSDLADKHRQAVDAQQRSAQRLAAIEGNLAAARADVVTLRAQVEAAQLARQALEERGRELAEAARAAQDRAADQGARFESLRAQLTDVNAQLSSSHAALARIKEDRDRLKDELQAHRQRSEDLGQQLQRQADLERRYSERILQLERQLTLGRSNRTGAADDDWKRIDSLWDDNKR